MQLITLEMMRQSLFAAVVSDALDSIGLRHQSPRIQLRPMTVHGVLAGRCKTTLWIDMAHQESKPYELVLQAIDSCHPDDVLIAAASGSMRSAIWDELLSTAAGNSGCVGAVVDGAVRDIARVRSLGFPVYARGSGVCDCLNRMRVVDLDVPVELGGVLFSPGDLMIADEDGVVVVHAGLFERLCADVRGESGLCAKLARLAVRRLTEAERFRRGCPIRCWNS